MTVSLTNSVLGLAYVMVLRNWITLGEIHCLFP